MTTGIINDQNLEKQIQKHMGGCMAGFFNLFDRNHVLSGKRVFIKRLPASAFESESDSISSFRSPESSAVELERPEQFKSAPSPEYQRPPPTPPSEPAVQIVDRMPVMSSPARSPVAVGSFEFKEGVKSPWKFTREAPRLSLDSRAVVDAKGKLHRRELRTGGGRCDAYVRNSGDDESDKQKRSPSVIARLMGLDQPMPSDSDAGDLPDKKAELRRSASESRSRDAFRFVDGNVFPVNQQYQSNSPFAATENMEKINGGREYNNIDNINVSNRFNVRAPDRRVNVEPSKPWAPPLQQRKGLYNAGDFFPEPKPEVTIYSELEKRLKMRGIEDSSQDLETLKQIFEALQLKGLLHSKQLPDQVGRRNFVYERRFHEESPIAVTKTSRSPRRMANDPSPPPGFKSKTVSRRNLDPIPSVSPRRDGVGMSRSAQSPNRNLNSRSPVRTENRSTSPVTTRRKLNAETQRRKNETPAMEPRRVSPVQSPRYGSRRTMDQMANQSPRRQRPTAEIRFAEDESSNISESSISSSSHTETEKLKMEDLKEGKSLLERCDKLLNSIAEITASRATAITELQPSPVSVLDSSFYKEESSPSPVMKRTIDFKDQFADLEDEMWSPSSSGDDSADHHDQLDPDFVYVSEILTALNSLTNDSDIFLGLENQRSMKGRDNTKTSRLKRQLIFDTVAEILDRNRGLPPWKSSSIRPELTQIWSELQTIDVKNEPEDLFEVICGVMKRDMAGDSIHGWGECHVEVSDAVLDIERLIFKDLIGESINSLAGIAVENGSISASRRKLEF
ncbi:hypothetical protein V2J09_015604 [Rumex salicifolius]